MTRNHCPFNPPSCDSGYEEKSGSRRGKSADKPAALPRRLRKTMICNLIVCILTGVGTLGRLDGNLGFRYRIVACPSVGLAATTSTHSRRNRVGRGISRHDSGF